MATFVDLSPQYVKTAMYTDGTSLPSDIGFDGGGYAYSGTLLGSGLTFNGVPFVFGPPNVFDSAQASTISLPAGNFASLWMLAAAYNGGQTGQSVIVTYSDTSQDTFTQSVSDWFSPASYPGESIAYAMPYRDKNDGTTDPRTFNLYAYSFPLHSSKITASVQLPATNVVVLAATLVPPGTPSLASHRYQPDGGSYSQNYFL